jgi:putative acetyltransferase
MLADGAPAVISSQTELARLDRELAARWQLHVAERRFHLVGMLSFKLREAILDQLLFYPASRDRVGKFVTEPRKRAMPDGFSLRTAAANLSASLVYRAKGLVMLREGIQPTSGYPVRFFGSIVR